MGTPKRKTKDGYEYQFGINHLGHFRLTNLLLPLMIKTEGERRIVCVSSMAHTMGTQEINFDDIFWEKSYSPWSSYGQSKLANIMFAKELNRKLLEDKIPITVNSLHPGVIPTELMRDNPIKGSILYTLGYLFMKSIPQGAATTVFAATAPELKDKGGLYLSDCNISSAIPYSDNKEEQKKIMGFQ